MSATVSEERYDQQAPDLRAETLPALSWELVAASDILAAVPVVRLAPQAEWIGEIAMLDAFYAIGDWRILIPAQLDLQRPALVRLDLTFPNDPRHLTVLWTVRAPEDFVVLGLIALIGVVGFKHAQDAHTGLTVKGLCLGEFDAYHELAALMRGPLLLSTLTDCAAFCGCSETSR
ncbi:hypothetical protein Q5424_04995 [Conexibacter sp. JD483]|uniref:hypothetical protein n=1 Tax=unclassified Conexibacter TaxID=2627773 RepID=UPI00271CEF3A|nr:MULTISPECIES: hypothetical protein [unclassified Conexibacter]MDO8184690.1 hypothetical protein [Conexibacter sp. CPCC 205706]MDO8197996.1 hypothetical protein [Conexibacter sp. CPCC 205762]MDR9368426.1 hypothetical protein [Conexibacter sp. JD483]